VVSRLRSASFDGQERPQATLFLVGAAFRLRINKVLNSIRPAAFPWPEDHGLPYVISFVRKYPRQPICLYQLILVGNKQPIEGRGNLNFYQFFDSIGIKAGEKKTFIRP